VTLFNEIIWVVLHDRPAAPSQGARHGPAGGHSGWPRAGGLVCRGGGVVLLYMHMMTLPHRHGPQVERHCTASSGGSFIPGPNRARLFAAAVTAFSTELVSAPAPTGGCAARRRGRPQVSFALALTSWCGPCPLQAPRTSTLFFTASRTVWFADRSASTTLGSRAPKRPSARRSSSQVGCSRISCAGIHHLCQGHCVLSSVKHANECRLWQMMRTGSRLNRQWPKSSQSCRWQRECMSTGLQSRASTVLPRWKAGRRPWSAKSSGSG